MDQRIPALALAAGLVAACGLSVDDLFTTGNGGAGGAGGAPTTTTTTHASSSHTSSSSSTTASSSSSTSSSSSSTTASSSGGPICGDGICSPGESQTFCPQDCGPTSSASSSSGGGTCGHDTCDTGDALATGCNACTTAVCGSDPFCCTNMWDNQCVGEADSMCGKCCGNGTCNNGEDCNSCTADCGPCTTMGECSHSVCAAGAALDPQKCHDPCADAVCAQKPACCGNASWDASCQMLAAQLCDADPCVTAVCAQKPACCTTGWTQPCIDQAKTSCQTQCGCAHSICQQGAALDGACDPCVKAMCKADSYCCTSAWDGVCAGEVETICGITCP